MANNREDEYSIDLDALRRQVTDGNFALRPHALQHAVKEGFTGDAGNSIIDLREATRFSLLGL